MRFFLCTYKKNNQIVWISGKCTNDNNVLEKLQKGWREGASRSSPYRTPLVFIERKGKLIFCVISAFCSHTTYTQLCSMQGIKHNTILPQSLKSFHFSGASLLISRRSLLFFHHLLFYLFTSPLLFPLSAGQGADPLVLLNGGAAISVDGPYLSSTESLPPGGCHGLPALPDTRC